MSHFHTQPNVLPRQAGDNHNETLKNKAFSADILSALRSGEANAVGIQGFHTSRFKKDDPRLLFLLKLAELVQLTVLQLAPL